MRRLVAVTSSVVLALGMVGSLTPAANADPTLYTAKVLSPAKGFEFATPYGLNDRGDVVGSSWNIPVANMREERSAATLWPASNPGKPVSMNFASGNSHAVAVSNDQTMVGNEGASRMGPFMYKAGKISRLTSANTSLPGVDDAVDISAAGLILTADASTWTGPTQRQMLPVPKGTYGSAGAISANGVHVVGGAGNSNLRWTNRVAVTLGVPAGSTSSQPTSVNDRGVAVGYALVADSSVPVIWDSKGSPSWLARYPGFGQQAPRAINNDGVAVGYGNVSPEAMAGYDKAFLWRDGKVMDLDGVVSKPAGAKIMSAFDINNKGQIVGTMNLSNGKQVGFIATPTGATPSDPPPVDIYTTPGTHHVNGRDWKTTCEKYSQTTRCRTEIIATEVKLVNGTYTHVKGWTFNNLTYLPSDRNLWKGNPLGNKGDYTIAGRQWRTDCDSPATGGNGCRSYILATKIKATPKGGGRYSYTQSNEWVFNNIVMFS